MTRHKEREGFSRFAIVLATLLTLVLVPSVPAQTRIDRVSPNSPTDHYMRTLELAGLAETRQMHYRSETTGSWNISESHPWRDHIPPSNSPLYAEVEQSSSYNPAYPHGGNDGRLWQGAGFNSALSAVAGYRLPFGLVQLGGTFVASQNASYDILPTTVGDGWGNYRGTPDVPQRFGDDPLLNSGLDETEIMAHHRTLYASMGWRDRWLGPTEENAIILSTNAAPYFSGVIGMLPTDTRAGRVEFHMDLGVVHESDFFDEDPENDRGLNMIATVAYAPQFLPGLTLGVNRQIRGYTSSLGEMIKTMGNFDMVSEYGSDQLDQRASITFDWTWPVAGFGVYGEWAKNDYSTKWRTIVREPEHSVAYTLGLTQVIRPTEESLLRLTFELTQLVWSRDYTLGIGGGGTFYGHGRVVQGNTHDGQELGAEIGSGSDSQTLRADWYSWWGSIGGTIKRVARDKDYLYGNPDNYWFVNDGPIAYLRQNVEMSYVIDANYWVGPWLFGAEIGYLNNINWNWIENNDLSGVRAALSVTRTF